MVSPVLNEHFYTGAFLVREANGYLSRDKGELVNETSADISFEAGLVLSDVSTVIADFVVGGSNTGNGTIGSITVAAGTKPSNYEIAFTDATNYTVSGPDGSQIGVGVAGTALDVGGCPSLYPQEPRPLLPGTRSPLLSYPVAPSSTSLIRGRQQLPLFCLIVCMSRPKRPGT